MMKTLRNIIVSLLLFAPALSFAGQHSGLGGGVPPAPQPAPDPNVFETIEQYYHQYYQWLREQADGDQQQPNYRDAKKG